MTTFAPGLQIARGYHRDWLRPDVLAGVTVAAYLIPQVMAYAQIVGLPPGTGLISFIGPAVAYAVFGASRNLSVGPESTTALMAASACASLGVAAGDRAAFVAALALVVGLVCLVGRLGRLGFLADLLSKPVLVGYMAGVAVLMVVSQIPKLTGIDVDGDSTLDEIGSAFRNAEQVHWPTVAFSALLIALLLVGSRLWRTFPVPLAVVLLASGAVAVLHLERFGLDTIGSLTASLGWPHLPTLQWGQVRDMLGPALGIVVVGYTDNVLTGRAFRRPDEPAPDANQEFVGLGAANLASGLLGGMPVSSSGSRTAIGVTLGARTQLYSVVALGSVVLVLLFGRGVLASFPTAALGALVFYAATRLVEVGEFRRIATFRRSELVLAVATTAAVLGFGVLNGIGIAIVLSLADLLRRVARPHDGVLGYVPGVAGMHAVDDYPNARQVPGLVVYRFDSPLFFANAGHFAERALEVLDEAPEPPQWLLLNVEAVVELDITSTDALVELVEQVQARGVVVAIARLKHELIDELEHAGLVSSIGADRIFPTLPTAVRAYLRWYVQRHGALPPGVTPIEVPSDPVNPEGPVTPEAR